MIVLDTDVLIEIMDRKSKRGERALERIIKSGEDFCITVINLHEILYGLYKYAKPVDEVMKLPVIGYTKEDAKLAAKLELEAEKKGRPIRRMDAMIAAITINARAKLYTLDVRHFKHLRAFGLELF